MFSATVAFRKSSYNGISLDSTDIHMQHSMGKQMMMKKYDLLMIDDDDNSATLTS
ncbi:hypothetical protein [Photorhabdus asymbiotica]|uniref:hypothetical protein n=1 Tax=Photorhabdus asymbiotica TaxID=291112 RepID=UPI003DA79F87